jgi:Tfp pilus assembly protein PilF
MVIALGANSVCFGRLTPPSAGNPGGSGHADYGHEDEASARFARGCWCLENGQVDAAIEHLARAFECRPDRVDYAVALARASSQAERCSADELLERAAERFPDCSEVQLAWIDLALGRGLASTALERLTRCDPRRRVEPEFALRAAKAYYQLDRLLGDAEVRSVAGGRAGQFLHGRLLVERRPGCDRFLCVPPESAMYQVRRALDGGLEDPAALVLHARIWSRMGRPEVGLSILKQREAVLLDDPDEGVLDAFCDLAFDADALSDYLRCSRMRAALQPGRRRNILFAACLATAERYCQRGDEALYVQWLYRAIRYKPDHQDALLRLADADWAAGRGRDAASLYRRLLQCCPDHPDRPRILRRLAESTSASSAP